MNHVTSHEKSACNFTQAEKSLSLSVFHRCVDVAEEFEFSAQIVLEKHVVLTVLIFAFNAHF